MCNSQEISWQTANLKKELLSILDEKSLHRKKVVLSSGKTSNYYFDGRVSSLHHKGAYLIGKIILDMIKDCEVSAIGGLTLGADPIIGATIALSCQTDKPLDGFIVRKEEKGHGMKKKIEGTPLTKESKVIIVDDVVTTGSSTIKAIEEVKQIGCEIVKVLAIVDRLEGAKENIAKYGLTLESIFTIKDFNI